MPERRTVHNAFIDRRFKPGDSVESDEVVPGIVFDYDANGVVVGIDIDDVDEAVGIDTLRQSA